MRFAMPLLDLFSSPARTALHNAFTKHLFAKAPVCQNTVILMLKLNISANKKFGGILEAFVDYN
jgi:hypothetical protein